MSDSEDQPLASRRKPAAATTKPAKVKKEEAEDSGMLLNGCGSSGCAGYCLCLFLASLRLRCSHCEEGTG